MGRVKVFETFPEAQAGGNIVINGAFDGFQWNEHLGGAFIGIGGGFSYQTADRFQIGHNLGDKTLQQTSVQGSGSPTSNRSINNLAFKSNHTGPAGDLQCRTFLEARNVAHLVGKRVSYGALLFSDSAQFVKLRAVAASSFNTFSGVDIAGGSITYDYILNGTTGSYVLVKVEDVLLPANAVNGVYLNIDFNTFLNTSGDRFHRVAEVMFNEGSVLRPFERFGGSIDTDDDARDFYMQFINYRGRPVDDVPGTRLVGIDWRKKLRAGPNFIRGINPGTGTNDQVGRYNDSAANVRTITNYVTIDNKGIEYLETSGGALTNSMYVTDLLVSSEII